MRKDIRTILDHEKTMKQINKQVKARLLRKQKAMFAYYKRLNEAKVCNRMCTGCSMKEFGTCEK